MVLPMQLPLFMRHSLPFNVALAQGRRHILLSSELSGAALCPALNGPSGYICWVTTFKLKKHIDSTHVKNNEMNLFSFKPCKDFWGLGWDLTEGQRTGGVHIFGLVWAVMGMKQGLTIRNRCKYRKKYSLDTGLFSPHSFSVVLYFFFTSLIFSAHCIMFSRALENILPPLFFQDCLLSPSDLVFLCISQAFSPFTLAELHVRKIHPFMLTSVLRTLIQDCPAPRGITRFSQTHRGRVTHHHK